MKKEIHWLVTGVKELVWYLFQVAVLSGAVILGFKWSGELVESIYEQVNVGIGLLFIFAAVAVFIYIDNKYSVEQKQSAGRTSCGKEKALR